MIITYLPSYMRERSSNVPVLVENKATSGDIHVARAESSSIVIWDFGISPLIHANKAHKISICITSKTLNYQYAKSPLIV